MIALVNSRFGKKFSDPIGIEYLAEVLTSKGYRAEMIDPTALQLTLESCVTYIENLHPQIIGISVISTYYREEALLLTNMLKKNIPNAFIVLGGQDPTFDYVSYFTLSNSFDAILLGEGEISICQLVQCIYENHDIRSVNGICIRDGDGIYLNEQLIRENNLDALPMIHHYCAKQYIRHHSLKEGRQGDGSGRQEDRGTVHLS